MELYENTHSQIENLKELKNNFSELSPGVVEFIVENIKNQIKNPVTRKTIVWDEKKHEATKMLIDARDNLLTELDLLLLGAVAPGTIRDDVSAPAPLNIPKELEAILKKAIKLELCSVKNDVYKWNKSKALLAYFAHRTSHFLKLDAGERNGIKLTSWKPFEMLFNVKGLALAYKDFDRYGGNPEGYKDVDKIFS